MSKRKTAAQRKAALEKVERKWVAELLSLPAHSKRRAEISSVLVPLQLKIVRGEYWYE